MPLFSVTIPAYKGKYLSEAIDSVLAQSFGDFELIIVDDNSPEDLKSVVDRYSDERIHYYRNEKNCGAVNVVDNWNICLNYCSGDYVICMGDDDRLLPCCLEEYAKLINKYPALNVYHAWTQIIDENGAVSQVLEPSPERESFYEMTYCRWTKYRRFIGDYCYSVKHLRNCGGYYKLPLAWMSDDITAARAAFENGIANTLRPCFEYRISNLTISCSTNMTEIKLKSSLDGHHWYRNELSQIDPLSLSHVDRWYYDKLLRMITPTCQRRMLGEIINDINKKKNRIFYWIRICPKYKISRSILLRKYYSEIIRKR